MEVNYMAIHYINGERIYYAFLAGASEIARCKALLNQINVFPVFDSDTGNNLSSTFNYMVDTVKPSRYAGETFRSLADASLSGARGNSGIIMAQFINGLSREIGGQKRLSTRAFGHSVLRAVPYAYGAVSSPVEGTILTVLHDWAEAVHKLGEETNDFVKILLHSLERARQSLKETPAKLKVLKDAAVVDAGAQGFVLFLEGVARLLKTGNLKSLLQESRAAVEIVEPLEGISGEIHFRYCSEALLTGAGMDHHRIRETVEHLGDSLIVAGTPEKAKIHMHTNHPEEFFFKLMDYGTIVQQKVDDMLKQYQVVHERKYEIALVTDSIADLPQEIMDQYQIHMIPINLQIEGSNFLDKISIKPGQIYSILDQVKEYPTSSQPSFEQVQQLLSYLANHYQSIIVISVSKELSGTFNVFNSVAETLRESGTKISVINSKTNSGAQGLLVLQAAELIAAGVEHDELVRTIEQYIPGTKIFVSVATFKYMVRGGRVSPMKGFVANLLNFKPIVSLDEEGRGVAFANALTRKSNTKKILNIVQSIQEQHPLSKYCIVHAGAPDKASSYQELFTRMLGKAPDYVAEISPIVALNAGLGAVAVGLISEAEAV
jgi:uncharacterized protein